MREIKEVRKKEESKYCDVIVNCCDNEYHHKVKIILNGEELVVVIPNFEDKETIYLARSRNRR